MSAHDETEKVLKKMHVLLSKSEPYPKEPSKVIVDKQEVLNLLSDLNKCIYNIMDEYELTKQSRDRAEREFRKQGDDIIWDASRKAEDIYAASIMYTDEALNRVWNLMHDTSEQIQMLSSQMEVSLKDQEHKIKNNQLELKSQLQDLRDTEKYISIIDDRNRELQRQKEVGAPKFKSNASIYANRKTEIKVNTEYLERMGYGSEEVPEEEAEEKPAKAEYTIKVKEPAPGEKESTDNKEKVSSKENDKITKEVPKESVKVKDKKDMTPEELDREEKLRADLDADYFDWKDSEGKDSAKTDTKKEPNDLAEGISKMWKNIKAGKNSFF